MRVGIVRILSVGHLVEDTRVRAVRLGHTQEQSDHHVASIQQAADYTHLQYQSLGHMAGHKKAVAVLEHQNHMDMTEVHRIHRSV